MNSHQRRKHRRNAERLAAALVAEARCSMPTRWVPFSWHLWAELTFEESAGGYIEADIQVVRPRRGRPILRLDARRSKAWWEPVA